MTGGEHAGQRGLPANKAAVTDTVVETAALELRRLLPELTASLDPFPRFMDAASIEAIEVEPDDATYPHRGCIVVCPDGELRELVLRMIPGPLDTGGVEQTEEVIEVDMPHGEYIAYAQAAVHQLTRIIEARRRSDG